jgi:hypothetical protein
MDDSGLLTRCFRNAFSLPDSKGIHKTNYSHICRMNLYRLKGLMCFGLLVSGLSANSQKTLTLTNPSSFQRTDEPITLTRAFLEKKLGRFPASKYIQLSLNKVPKVVQFDDLNKDGIWDEAFILQSFAKSQTIVFNVAVTDHPATVKAVVRAHVRQKRKLADQTFGDQLMVDTMPYNNPPTDFSKQKLPPFLTEGPAWENDKVGFRKYFDTRNANDIWGKVTPRMVLDEVGADPSKSYHNFNEEWGMDILKVGPSVGAGALALQTRISNVDTLVRFGRNVKLTTYEQVADGPLRAIFRIRYSGWKIGSLSPIDVTEEISIAGGQYYFTNKVTLKGAPANSKLVTGLNNFYIKTADSSTSPVSVLSTFGTQSENRGGLGMAVLFPGKASFGKAPDAGSDVMNMFTISMPVNANPLSYRFYSCWEMTDKKFASSTEYKNYLGLEAAKMAAPVIFK